MQLKTAGDLRGFLAGVLVGIRDGTIDAAQASSISKVAAQINQSLATEVQARINLKDLGGEAGAMVIASGEHVRDVPKLVEAAPPAPSEQFAESAKKVVAVAPARARTDADKIWCDQCDMQVTAGQAVGCKSPFCKAKDAA